MEKEKKKKNLISFILIYFSFLFGSFFFSAFRNLEYMYVRILLSKLCRRLTKFNLWKKKKNKRREKNRQIFWHVGERGQGKGKGVWVVCVCMCVLFFSPWSLPSSFFFSPSFRVTPRGVVCKYCMCNINRSDGKKPKPPPPTNSHTCTHMSTWWW